MTAIAPKSTTVAVVSVTTKQYGVISRDQALACGLTPSAIQNLVASGRWIRVHRGVYVVAGAPAGWYQSLLAACLAGGDKTLASHRAAAALLEFDGFRPGPTEVSSTRKIRRPGIVVHRVKRWLPADVWKVRGIPCTDPARTLIDLAGGGGPVQRLEIAFHDVLTRLLSVPRLTWRLDLETTGRAGVGLLKNWIEELGPAGRPSESGFEVLLYRLLVDHGLPRPIRQYPVRVGRRARRIDLAYPDERLAIEAVGYESHRGKLKWQSDLGRGNELQSLGWRVLNITWDQFTRDPERVVALVRQFLRC